MYHIMYVLQVGVCFRVGPTGMIRSMTHKSGIKALSLRINLRTKKSELVWIFVKVNDWVLWCSQIEYCGPSEGDASFILGIITLATDNVMSGMRWSVPQELSLGWG